MPDYSKYAKYKVFETENEVIVKVTFTKGSLQVPEDYQSMKGICAGQSALWCLHILEKRECPKPSYLRAAALQSTYQGVGHAEGRGDDGLMEWAGLTCLGTLKKAAWEVVLEMRFNEGVYLIGAPGHWMAAATNSGKGEFKYFNPDAGMFSGMDGPGFEQILLEGRQTGRTWVVYKVGLA
ncbi:MAG: hypothetical protein SFV54_05015 [Bryobacteraceae bacterium]|nr:hypothetical protein [Bryobacteraceae bacterium]